MPHHPTSPWQRQGPLGHPQAIAATTARRVRDRAGRTAAAVR